MAQMSENHLCQLEGAALTHLVYSAAGETGAHARHCV